MKKNLLASILMLSIGAISCSNSTEFGGDEGKVLETLAKGQFYHVSGDNGQEFSEVKLIRDITAEDSLNLLLNEPTVKKIIEEHNRMLENIQYQISKESDPTYAYDASSTVEERIDEINQFADAWAGTFNDKFYFNTYYKNIYRLRNLPKDQVIAKVYTVTHKRKIDDKEWSTDYWLMSPDLSACLGKIQAEQTGEIPKSTIDIEKIHFDPVIDSRSFISTGTE
jgi:hypothetical protein